MYVICINVIFASPVLENFAYVMRVYSAKGSGPIDPIALNLYRVTALEMPTHFEYKHKPFLPLTALNNCETNL